MSQAIPNYELYGETAASQMPDLLHCERISVRSLLHAGEILPHRHDGLLQILFIEQGRATVTIEGLEETLAERFVLVVPALSVHGFQFSDETEGWVLTLPTASLFDLLRTAPHIAEQVAVQGLYRDGETDLNLGEVSSLFQRIDTEFSGARPGRYVALRAAVGLLLLAIARANPTPGMSAPVVNSRKIAQLSKFRERVEVRFRHHDSIETYAKDIGMTPTHLNRVCREITAKTALQILHERLIVEAKRDLAYAAIAVNEIGLDLGFTDPAYFTRFFSRLAGQSPSAYRRAAQQELTAGSSA